MWVRRAVLQALAEQQKWKAGCWAFDGRKNIYAPTLYLNKEERSYRVRAYPSEIPAPS